MKRTIINFAMFTVALITWAVLDLTGHNDAQLKSILALLLGSASTSHFLQISGQETQTKTGTQK